MINRQYLDLIATTIDTQHQMARSALFEPLEKMGLARYHGIKEKDLGHACKPSYNQFLCDTWPEAVEAKLVPLREAWSAIGAELDVPAKLHVYFNQAVCSCAEKVTRVAFSVRASITWHEIKFMREYLLHQERR